MAVSISTVGINTADAGTWTRTQALDLLGIGLSIAQLHGSPVSGIPVGVSTFTGGGKVAISGDKYYQDVEPISTTGIGTGASFFIYRESDNQHINGISVNRPGYGYTGGEVVTISAEDIGGSVNGASNLELTLVVDADISGGTGYALTFTGAGSTSIESRGYDKNGYQSIGTSRTYVFKEGDTISFTNSTTNESYSREYMALVRYAMDKPTASTAGYAYTHYVWSYGGSTEAGGFTTSWTPSPGEAGTYFYTREYSSNEDNTVIIVEPADGANISTISYGSTTGWYDQNPDETSSSAGRVLKLDVDSSKKYGTTYHMIFHRNDDGLYTNGYAGWMPVNTRERYPAYYQDFMGRVDVLGGHGYGKRWAGSWQVDGGDYGAIHNNYESMFNNTYMASSSYGMRRVNYQQLCTLPTSYTGYQLDLKIYKSGIDPNFVVFIWKLPTLSSSDINDNTTAPFFFHNFTTSVFDLDDYNLGTTSRVDSYGSYNFTSNNQKPYLNFYTHLINIDGGRRSAMWGYAGDYQFYSNCYYSANVHSQASNTGEQRIYYRPDSSDERYTTRMTPNNSTYVGRDIPSSASSNNVIKGLPLNGHLVPSPYYIPDDFVLIQFDYNAVSANIQNGDTVTISGSEVYEVITGSYDTDDGGRTKGILFCARTV